MSATKAKARVDVSKLVRRYQKAKASGKRAYARADDLLAQIAESVAPGEEIDLGPGQRAVLIDRFADKIIVWTPCGARRWDLEVKVVAS